MAHPLHERGVAHASHDLLIHGARPISPHRLASHHLTVDRKRHVLERGSLRQRQQVIGLTDDGSPIDVGVRDFIADHAALEINAHLT